MTQDLQTLSVGVPYPVHLWYTFLKSDTLQMWRVYQRGLERWIADLLQPVFDNLVTDGMVPRFVQASSWPTVLVCWQCPPCILLSPAKSFSPPCVVTAACNAWSFALMHRSPTAMR